MAKKKGLDKKNTSNKKHAGGRPPRYRKEFCIQAAKLCKLGAIDTDLADFFGVCEKTINNWKEKYPEFLQSINKEKYYSNDKVKRSLYERALGYSHPDVHISNYQGKITVTDIEKHYPPDTGAAFIWLKNRDPENWRDKHEVTITDITIGKPPTLDEAEFPE